jgi:hypothetical protein
MDELSTTFEMETARLERSMAELASTLTSEMRQLYLFTVRWVVGSILVAGSLGFAAGRMLR